MFEEEDNLAFQYQYAMNKTHNQIIIINLKK